MRQNPWAGLASYQDPASGSTLLFCGRDNESYDLAALVDDNIFCTLYGKSGTGKTSLLNAGMFPRLRAMGYLPLSIRLGMEAIGSTFQQCIAARLGKAATLQTADTVPLPADDQDEQWLWAWFARTRFVDSEGQVRFPVLVFDQFEEVFRSRRTEAETLLRQVHFMMDPSHSLGDDYDYNFRFLASIREDDLYLLEDSLDRCYLDEMKKCRYRLRALTYENALSVVLKPGAGLFNPQEASEIAEMVIDLARSEQDDTINTNLLSLLCSRLYAEKERKNAEYITLEMVGEFMEENPFIQFYNEATAGFHTSERNYIEDNMVDSAGRRNSISELDFRMHVRNADRLLEGNNKILQRTSVGGGGQDYRIELIHDSFCEPLVEIKERRGSRQMIWWMIGGFLLLCGIVAATYSPLTLWMRVETDRALENNRLLSSESSLALNNGDVDLAVRLALEGLKGDGRNKIVFVPEAYSTLLTAMQQHPAFVHLFAVREVDMDTVTSPIYDFIPSQDTIILDEFGLAMFYCIKDPGPEVCFYMDEEITIEDSIIGRSIPLVTYNLNGFDRCYTTCTKDYKRFFWKDSEGNAIELLYPKLLDLIDLAEKYYAEQRWTHEEIAKYRIRFKNQDIYDGIVRYVMHREEIVNVL